MPLTSQKASDLENGVNQGVIESTLEELAPEGNLTLQVLSPDSNWDSFLSDFDTQLGNNLETNGCNIFSSVHCVESLANALGSYPYYASSGKTELSERELCVACGLTGDSGSSEQQWRVGFLTGAVKHELLPFTEFMTKTEFFAPLTQEIKTEALKFLDNYAISFRQVGTDKASLIEALKYAPVKVFIGTGGAWNNAEPFVIPKNSNPMNHAVMLRKIDDLGFHIYDQYAPYLKCLAPDYIIYYAFQTLLTKKGNQMQLIRDNGTIFLVSTDKSSKIGIGNQDVLTNFFPTEQIVDEDTSHIPQTGTLADGVILHK